MYRPRRRTCEAARAAPERSDAPPAATLGAEGQAFWRPGGPTRGRLHSRTAEDLRHPGRALLARLLRSVEEVRRARAGASNPHRSQGRGKSTLDRDRVRRWREEYWVL